jgi:hypothetical protein
VSPEEFKTWNNKAKPGEVVVYFIGAYAHGSETARVARESAERGEVTLFQRRLRPHMFAYEAMRMSGRLGKFLAPHWRV